MKQTEDTEGSSKNGHCQNSEADRRHRGKLKAQREKLKARSLSQTIKQTHTESPSAVTVTEQLYRQKRQKRKAQSTVTVVEQSNRQKTHPARMKERTSKHGHCHRTVEQTEDTHTEPPSAIIVTEQSNRQNPTACTHAQREGIQSPEEKRWVLSADLKDAMDAKYRLRAQGE